MQAALVAYLTGVLLGLWRTDGPPSAKLLHALCWPLGPLAFAVTIAVLLAASLVAFPALGAAVAVGGAMLWWIAGW